MNPVSPGKLPSAGLLPLRSVFMLRSDKLGVTSVIRDLALSPGSYDSMLHFFRASSWSLEDIRRRWFSAVMDHAPFIGRRLPCSCRRWGKAVKRRTPDAWRSKKLFQESENSAKPEYIHGHMFGGLGILAGSVRSGHASLKSIRLHDGLQAARRMERCACIHASSHVVQMVEDATSCPVLLGTACSCWTGISLPFRHLKS